MHFRGNYFGEDLLLREDRQTAIQLIKRVIELSSMENEQLVSEYPELASALGMKSICDHPEAKLVTNDDW